RCANLCIVDRHGRKKDAAPVEIAVSAVDPKLAKSESHIVSRIEHSALVVKQRKPQSLDVLGRVQIPELVRLPRNRDHDASVLKRCRADLLARECDLMSVVPNDLRRKCVRPFRNQSIKSQIERESSATHRRLDADIANALRAWSRHKINIAAKTAPRNRSL